MSMGRVSMNGLTQRMISKLTDSVKSQEELFEKISSGKNILRPSDDPIGLSRSMGLNDNLNRLSEYENVISAADVWTNITTASLDSATSTWKRVNEVAIGAADGTKTAEDRLAMAEELEQLLQHMIQIGNTTHGGRYIFSGSKTQTPAFNVETDPNTGRVTGVFFQGNSETREVKTKDGGVVPINALGSNGGNPDVPGTFIDSTSGVNAFNTLIELRDKLLNNDTIGLSGEGGVIEDIEKAARNITTSQVRVGGSQEILELDKNRLIEQNSIIEQRISEIEDADTVQLILELNNIQNVYEAALSAGGKLFQQGLLNFI